MAQIEYEIIDNGWIDPAKIRTDAQYQRGFEKSNVNSIIRSLEATEQYDSSQLIVVNPDWQAVNGKQRVKAAILKGIKEVGYVMFKFRSLDDEIDYFHIMNEKTRGVGTRDLLYSGYDKPTKVKYCELVYKLCNDPRCKLYDIHDLKMGPDHKPSRHKIKVENICYIINHLVFGTRNGFSKMKGTAGLKQSKKANEILTDPNGINNSIEKINSFMNYFFDAFGTGTDKKDFKFRDAFIKGNLQVYYDILSKSKVFLKKRKQKIKKLQSFRLTEEATKRHKDDIAREIQDHLNFRVTIPKNRVVRDLE